MGLLDKLSDWWNGTPSEPSTPTESGRRKDIDRRTCPNCGNPGLGSATAICPRCGTRVAQQTGITATQAVAAVAIAAAATVAFVFGGEIIAAGGAVVAGVSSLAAGASTTELATGTVLVAVGVIGTSKAEAGTQPTATKPEPGGD